MYNFIYSTSNIYAPYCLVSMRSLLENNPDLKPSHFYVLSNDIDESNKQKMEELCEEYNCMLSIIDCIPVIESIFEDGAILNFNPSSFLRIFIPQILPELDKALFLDSDTLVFQGIKELYDTDISDYYCAMSFNMPIYSTMLNEAQLDFDSGYYNAGVILLNLELWRQDNIQGRILRYYFSHGGNFPTDDQSVINAIVSHRTMVIPYKYNAMIGTFYWSYKKFCSINTEIGKKSYAEYMEAKSKPVIVHFNGPGVRPWEHLCAHPYSKDYQRVLKTLYPRYNLVWHNGGFIWNIAQFLKHKVVDTSECYIRKGNQ